MTAEQQKTVQTFRENFSSRKGEKIIIYGTGINAEAVVTQCSEYRFVGLLDAAKTGELFWGLKVLLEEEVISSGCKCIVVIARPAVHSIIYSRIKAWTSKHNIAVYDIYGNLIADKLQDKERLNPYFDKSYESLWKEIQDHEVISFDIFDTLLVRSTYEPIDVFRLLDAEFAGKYPFTFSKERIAAEKALEGEPDIYTIYQKIGEKCGLVESECRELMQREVEKELQVLSVRDCMVNCLRDCIKRGKEVYLI